ncbi:helix-turn-helix transcriptional regulator [Microbacterium sp. NPDC091313]
MPYVRSPGLSLARFEDSRADLVSIDTRVFRWLASGYLEGTGQRLLDASAERSTPTPDGARLWSAAADALALDDGTSPLRQSVLEDLVVATLLTAFPFVTDAEGAPGRAMPRAMRRACALIEEHLHEPITIPQIAAAARVSVRTLETRFRDVYGLSPRDYLRDARMRAAHDELLRADPKRTTVAAVARRWGLGHAGRFTARYREYYGEGPADTLRR